MKDINKINPVLRDRLTIININGYTISEKINIGMNYLLPKISADMKLNNDVIIDRQTMKYIVEKHCPNLGVRDLDQTLELIFKRINLLKRNLHEKKRIKLSYDFHIAFPLNVTVNIVDQLTNNC